MKEALLDKEEVRSLVRDAVTICLTSTMFKTENRSVRFKVGNETYLFKTFSPSSATDSTRLMVSTEDEKSAIKTNKINYSLYRVPKDQKDRLIDEACSAHTRIKESVFSGGNVIMDLHIIPEINNCGCTFIHSLSYSGNHNHSGIFAYVLDWINETFDSCMVSFTDRQDGNIITLAKQIEGMSGYYFDVSITNSKVNPNSGNDIFAGVIMNNSSKFDYDNDDDY